MKWGLPIIERFYAYIIKLPSGCWEWSGQDKSHNPKFRVQRHPSTIVSVRRFAWEHQNQKRLHKQRLRSNCTNPRCVNPNHALTEMTTPRKELLKRQRIATKELVTSSKASGCRRCGISNPVVLEFHHRDPLTKKFAISGAKNRSILTVMQEIAKCDVLCANCHRLEHAK